MAWSLIGIELPRAASSLTAGAERGAGCDRGRRFPARAVMATDRPARGVQREFLIPHAANPVRNPCSTDVMLAVATLGPRVVAGATSGQLTPVICVAAYRAESSNAASSP